MRLGQLARKLALRPGEIVAFLSGSNIQIEEGSNTRLQDEHVVLVMQHFAPASTEEVVAELALEHKQDEKPSASEETADSNIEKERAMVSDEETAELPETEPEVIRAPKIELSGLRVVGKIDLPEPRKKQTPVEPLPESSADDTQKAFARKKQYPKKDQRRQEKNPIALQREREAQDMIKKREAKIRAEKEKKTQNYFKKVNASAPTKKVKMVEEPVVEATAGELAEPPKTLLGKFFRWLKT